MQKFFDGKKIRNEIISELEKKLKKLERKPTLYAFWIGENEVSGRYVNIKAKVASSLGINTKVMKLNAIISQEEVVEQIKMLNEDKNVNGIMVQMPLPDHLDKFEIVNAISPSKDVDGLRFCGGFKSEHIPPVVRAILKAIELSGKDIKKSEVVIVGRGFLVGWPLAQCLEEAIEGLIVVDRNTKDLEAITKAADILISATGVGGIIKPEMIKDGVVLIDAGTAEVGGKLAGDIDPKCYKKASYYTPVPGGIGPVTVAMLMDNLVK